MANDRSLSLDRAPSTSRSLSLQGVLRGASLLGNRGPAVMYLRSPRTLRVTLFSDLIIYLYKVIPCHCTSLNAWRRIDYLALFIYTIFNDKTL